MNENLNEAQGELNAELTAENLQAEHEETPAEHMTRMIELAKAIELAAQDLQDQLRDLNHSVI